MKITYRKNTGEVTFVGEGISHGDSMETMDYSFSQEERQKFQEGYALFFQNGKLEFRPTPAILEKEKTKKMKDDFTVDLEAIQAANNFTELRPLLIKLATKCYNQ